MEKKGRVSTVGFVLAVTSGGLGASSSAHLSIAPFRVMSSMGVAPVAQFSLGPSTRVGYVNLSGGSKRLGAESQP
jgi:hypothetical protein